MKLRTLIALLSCVVLIAAFGGDRVVKLIVDRMETAAHSEPAAPAQDSIQPMEQV